MEESSIAAAEAELGLSGSYTKDDLVKTYRKLIKENHPDRAEDDTDKEARMKRTAAVNDSYRRLLALFGSRPEGYTVTCSPVDAEDADGSARWAPSEQHATARRRRPAQRAAETAGAAAGGGYAAPVGDPTAGGTDDAEVPGGHRGSDRSGTDGAGPAQGSSGATAEPAWDSASSTAAGSTAAARTAKMGAAGSGSAAAPRTGARRGRGADGAKSGASRLRLQKIALGGILVVAALVAAQLFGGINLQYLLSGGTVPTQAQQADGGAGDSSGDTTDSSSDSGAASSDTGAQKGDVAATIKDDSELMGALVDTSYTGHSFAVQVRSASNGNKWGLMNPNGTWTVAPFFPSMPEDTDVQLYRFEGEDASGSGLWGFVDRKGTWKIEPKFKAVGEFHEGHAAAQDADSEKWGVIDPSGAWTVKPKYDGIGNFSEGTAPVAMNSKGEQACGYIDEKGNEVIPLNGNWSTAAPFSEGLAAVRLKNGGAVVYIDANGEVKLRAAGTDASTARFDDGTSWTTATPFHDGLAHVGTGRSDYYIHADGSKAFDGTGTGYGVGDALGLAVLSSGGYAGKYVYVDGNGNIVANRYYQEADVFHNGYGAVEYAETNDGSDRQFGVVDTSGNSVVSLSVKDRYADVSVNDIASAGPESLKIDRKHDYTCARAGGKALW